MAESFRQSVFLHVRARILARIARRGPAKSVTPFVTNNQGPIAPGWENQTVLTDLRLHC